MKKIIPIIIASSLMVSGAQAASYNNQNTPKKARPTYNYAGIKYTSQKLDEFDCTQDGVNVNGSFDVNGQVFVQGAFGDVSGENCGSSSLIVGGGYRAAWGSSSYAYGKISFEDISPDVGDGDSGIVLAGGLRGFLVPGIEGYIEAAHHTAFDGATVINGGGAYWFNGQFAMTGDLSMGSDQFTWGIGARLAF